ncbi:MAG: glycosyltransferase family 39 protein, partial [Nitriliruptorales bacterium]|nr:glycosyltransferase family 39 protein [Nitriliruptorales bacterium]
MTTTLADEEGHRSRARSWNHPRTWLTIAALTAAYLVLQWSVLPTIHWGDTLRVFLYATTWPDVPIDHHALRIGLIGPTWLSQQLLGYGQVAFYAVSFAFGIALVVGMYAAGRALFDETVGIVASLTLLLSPYVVDTERFLTSGLILPDLPSAAIFTLGVAALVTAIRRESGRWQQGLLVTAGLLFGSAYLIREFVPAMFVIIPLAFLLWRVPLRRLGWVLGPMLLIWLGESTLNAIVHGDALIRLNVSSEHGRVLEDPVTTTETLRFWWRAFTDSNRGMLLVGMLGLNVAGVAFFRDRRLVLTLAWFGSLFIALLALGGLLDARSPALRIVLTRYWFPVFPALVLGGIG